MSSSTDKRETSPFDRDLEAVTAQDMSAWSMRQAQRAFSGLSAPQASDLVGRWDGTMVGSPGLQRLSRAIALFTPLRGWCGKRVEATGLVHNLVRRGGTTRQATDCWASGGTSLLDGRPALVADYSRTARPPVKWLRGEMRWLVPGVQVLGVLVFPIGRRTIGPFPFQMTRSPD